MRKIVLFIEPQEEKWITPLKIGNLFMNRFAIDEDGCHEILKIYYLDNTFYDYHFKFNPVLRFLLIHHDNNSNMYCQVDKFSTFRGTRLRQ